MAVVASYGQPQGLAGATATALYAGATGGGGPTSGTHEVGEQVMDQTGAVWICTVAGTPGTWQRIARSGIGNEFMAARLVNATSPGDAGNRSDHFLGSSLGVQWIHDTAVSATPISGVGDSVVFCQTPAGGSFYYEAFTPSGDYDIHMRCSMSTPANGSVGVYVTDSGGAQSGGTGNGSAMLLVTGDSGNTRVYLYTLVTGTYNQVGTFGVQGTNMAQFWTYLRTQRIGGTLFWYWCQDRATWDGPATAAFTFTVARLYLAFGAGDRAGIDFIDVVA